MLEQLLYGAQIVFTVENLLAILVGTTVGLFVGAIPGLGSTIGVALLLPITYELPPIPCILLLIALYEAAEYGGSISSILISTPGTPAATATLLDGYPLTKQNKPGLALGYSLTASTLGGIIGVLVLIFLSKPLALVAVSFTAAEYFALGVFGLTAVASLSSSSPAKGFISALFGIFLTTIGLDVFSGAPRFTLGTMELYEGIPLIPLLVGLFALSEVFIMVGEELDQKYEGGKKGLSSWLKLKDIKNALRPILLGGPIGGFIGMFPGLGAGPAGWFAYNEVRRTSKNPESFGKGNPQGVAAAESANNAAVGGALVPLLTLGIPGSPTTAVILSALIIQGIEPGPAIFTRNADLVYGIFVGLFIATIMMYCVGLLATRMWSRVVAIPKSVLAPIILVLSIIGSYAPRGLFFDVWLLFIFGIIGYLFRKFDFSLPALVIGFVLGFMIENSLRRALVISDNGFWIFFTRPVSLVILLLAVGSIIFSVVREKKSKQRAKDNTAKGDV